MRLDGAEGVSPAERPGFSFSGGLDLRQGKIAAADDEIVWKAQDGEALGAEIGIAFAIVNALFLSIVRRSIEFDDKAAAHAEKICDIPANGYLTAEFHGLETRAAQRTPKDCFGDGHRAP
jgi:hypothetical protein